MRRAPRQIVSSMTLSKRLSRAIRPVIATTGAFIRRRRRLSRIFDHISMVARPATKALVPDRIRLGANSLRSRPIPAESPPLTQETCMKTSILAALLIGTSFTAAAADYHIRRVDFPGASSTFLFALNDETHCVGAEADQNGLFHAIVFKNGVLRLLDANGLIG